MVSREGRYCGAPSKGSRGAALCNTLPPTIFNMVVDALIHHYTEMVAGEYAVPEGLRRMVHNLAAIFHMENRLISSHRPARLQEALDVLMGIFDWIVPMKNVAKTVGMVCQPCCTADRKPKLAYTRRIMGEGTSYRSKKRERVKCTECGLELAAGSLEDH